MNTCPEMPEGWEGPELTECSGDILIGFDFSTDLKYIPFEVVSIDKGCANLRTIGPDDDMTVVLHLHPDKLNEGQNTEK